VRGVIGPNSDEFLLSGISRDRHLPGVGQAAWTFLPIDRQASVLGRRVHIKTCPLKNE
jgi:hypothetical protein